MLDVKPTWLVNLEEKCKKEPDKIHVVFFDELTNALHAIQGMAFNIILDREVNDFSSKFTNQVGFTSSIYPSLTITS